MKILYTATDPSGNGAFSRDFDRDNLPGNWIITEEEWVEPVEDNEMLRSKYDNWLKEKVTYLLVKAEGAAIGKTGEVDYIQSQIKLYEQKYQACITLNPIPEIEADLEAEGLRDFNLSLVDFKALIISMYESSRDAYQLFVHYIEQCRSAILTMMANNDWEKVEQARVIADSLAVPEQAQDVKNQILAL